MSLYRNFTIVEATRWFKNGDHPKDRVGEMEIDQGWVSDVNKKDIPKEAYYTRVEGSVVRYFRLPPPGLNGKDIHKLCGFSWHNHGWIDEREDGITVCPGDWVITDKFYGGHIVVKHDVFEITYQVVNEAKQVDKRPHSRACGICKHDHGGDCSSNCPTCGGKKEI